MNVTQQGIVTLIKSAITGQSLPLPEGFSLEEADGIVQSQSLLPLVYQGAYHCGVAMDSPLMQRYRNQYFRHMLLGQKQERAVARICRAFDENSIDYLLLKGCVVKKYYPQPELRPMGDADILIRTEQYARIVGLMNKLGFTPEGESHHELVWHSRDLHLELHKCLFSPTEKDLYAYFGTGWNLVMEKRGCCHELPAEVIFVYLFAHMAKHYRSSGIGVRHIVDLFVFEQAYPALNERAIEDSLRQMALLDFYKNIKKTIAVWFAGDTSDEMTDHISDYVLSGGSWGDIQTRFLSEQVQDSGGKAVRRTRIKIAIKVLFPPLEKLQFDYPILYHYPKLYPLFWIPRWIKGLFCRPKEILRKLSVLRSITDEKVDGRKRMLQYVGLFFEE